MPEVPEGRIDWDNKEISGSSSTLFKLEEEYTARICVLSKQAIMVKDHYSTKTKKHARCIRSKGLCPGCEHIGEPKERFATKILVYGTDKAGNLTKPVKFAIQVWIFSADKFVQLRGIRKEWGDLSERDLMVTCPKGGKQYQKMTFVPANKCLWLSNEKVSAKVKEMFKNNKVDLETLLGKHLSTEEMAKRLGIDVELEILDDSVLSDDAIDLDLDVSVNEEKKPSPAKASPAKASPAKASPAKASPAKASPTKPSPAVVEDTLDDVVVEEESTESLDDIDSALDGLEI